MIDQILIVVSQVRHDKETGNWVVDGEEIDGTSYEKTDFYAYEKKPARLAYDWLTDVDGCLNVCDLFFNYWKRRFTDVP